MRQGFAIAIMLLLAACAQHELTVTPTPIGEQASFIITGVEGELLRLSPTAADPDNDTITYAYTAPFNKQGVWQTALGDEGTYYVAVTASDGKGGEATETVKVIVTHRNRDPVIACGTFSVDELDLINLSAYCTVTDEDSDDLTIGITGWMTTWERQTTYDDAGQHLIFIHAEDDEGGEATHELTFTVRDVNRAPTFDGFPERLSGTEGDTLIIPTQGIGDPDGDRLTITFGAPFDGDGIWETGRGDAGTYDVDVVVSDGEAVEKRTVHVVLSLLNTPPVLRFIPDISVREGDVITLPISATDREGDALMVEISGWMRAAEYATTYQDAGTYTTRVRVSDGVHDVEQLVHITVADRNRPPYFVA